MARKKKIIENLELERMAAGGKAVAHADGKVVFVEAGIPGEVVDVRLKKNKKDYAEGYIINRIKATPDRIEPFCPHFNYCGGCRWQHLSYEKQLAYKQAVVYDTIERIGKCHPQEKLPIIGSEKTRAYRNKMDYGFSNQRWLTPDEIASGREYAHRNALGFHVPRAFDKILDIETCYLQDDLGNRIRNSVRAFALEQRISFFDIKAKTGALRSLIIRNTTAGEWMVIVVFHDATKDEQEALLNHITDEFPDLASLYFAINPKANDTIFDLPLTLRKGKTHITEYLGNIRYEIGPKSFFQTNPTQAKILYDTVVKNAGLTPEMTVYDLYTGTGSIALYLAAQCKKVIGIENIPEAIEDARKNAVINQIDNVEFHTGDMKDILIPAFVAQHGSPNVVITDPPRAGMHPAVIDTLLKAGPQKIVYVSCNPSTQARDVGLLSEKYDLHSIQPVDMFPHTWHIENIAVLEKKQAGHE